MGAHTCAIVQPGKGFMTSDFSKRDEFSMTLRAEQLRQQIQVGTGSAWRWRAGREGKALPGRQAPHMNGGRETPPMDATSGRRPAGAFQYACNEGPAGAFQNACMKGNRWGRTLLSYDLLPSATMCASQLGAA